MTIPGPRREGYDPSTFVLVKEDRTDPGTYGVCCKITTSEGAVRGFVREFQPSVVEQFPTRQAAIDVAREIGGVPHTYTAGRELIEIGTPTYVIEPTDGAMGRVL